MVEKDSSFPRVNSLNFGFHSQVTFYRRDLPSTYRLKRPVLKTMKHGYVCLALPATVFLMDLTINCDVSPNPGLPLLEN